MVIKRLKMPIPVGKIIAARVLSNPEIAHHHVRRDQSAAEEHGEDESDRDDPPPDQVVSR